MRSVFRWERTLGGENFTTVSKSSYLSPLLIQRFRALANDDGVSILYFTMKMVKEILNRLISDNIASSYFLKGIVECI